MKKHFRGINRGGLGQGGSRRSEILSETLVSDLISMRAVVSP